MVELRRAVRQPRCPAYNAILLVNVAAREEDEPGGGLPDVVVDPGVRPSIKHHIVMSSIVVGMRGSSARFSENWSVLSHEERNEDQATEEQGRVVVDGQIARVMRGTSRAVSRHGHPITASP